jgi:hypothetical protein
MTDHLKHILAAQFEAALCMLRNCIRKCPPEHWDGPTHLIAKYCFWQVAYHTLCFVDLYLSPSDAAWRPRTGKGGLHPAGRAELDEEYPSRRFSQAELLAYLSICRQKMREVLGDTPAAETRKSLEGPSGFRRLRFSRAELHLYNIRHVQHHAGQLGAYLRRVGVDTPWVKSGWR